IANSISPSLALPLFASWKTHCDGRAFFIARSILSHKRPMAAFSESAEMVNQSFICPFMLLRSIPYRQTWKKVSELFFCFDGLVFSRSAAGADCEVDVQPPT
ncbi:MAG: hypothetical protein KKE86_04035, partial [Planctomycetes bacterium]|nr:hypothetical protein [Planctomycetota bacterium]MBU4398487.1 hypothetical protein [Planctomycetota bacterium]MCG2682828.1 hypothetical protein [Planctomycetales bacterium]